MSEQQTRHEAHDWEKLTPQEVLAAVVYELYNPVSTLGSHLDRLIGDDDPLSEDDYDMLFVQMQEAVNQLSRTIVHLKHYTQRHPTPHPDET